LGAAGKGVLQVVSDFLDLDAEFAILRKMVERSGRPLSMSIAQAGRSDNWRRILDSITEANRDGLKMTGQVSTRAIGLLMGLSCTLNPFMVNPVWREIAGLSVAEAARAMSDPAFKERVLAAATDETARGKLGGRLIGRFEFMYPLGEPPDYEPDPSTSIAAQAEREGRSPEDVAYDYMIGDEGRAFLYLPILNYATGNLDAVGEMLAHPHTVPGLGDGGAHVGTICDGSFPTTLLSLWGRDRDRGRLEVPFIIQRHCRDTARTVGLYDRGVLAPGYKGDVNVIDFENLSVHCPEMRYDLPAGGKRLLQRAEGYAHTIVSGVEVYRDGKATGELPGKLIRGAQQPNSRQ
jgi:N-acyl-D-aspartate/D-glutamate deacylase